MPPARSGGGAFFLIFVVFTLLIGFPLLISEYIIGRGSGKEAISAFKKLAPDSLWAWIGRFGVLGSFLLLSFYSVVGGWVLIYSVLSLVGAVIRDGKDYGALFGYDYRDTVDYDSRFRALYYPERHRHCIRSAKRN